jgi:PTS system N-acetylgalactosamine-specific IIC component
MVFAVKANMDVNTALGTAVIFSLFGQYAVTLTFTFMSGMMAKADKAAADANPAGITQVNLISMGLLGSLFAVCAVLAYIGGEAMAGPMTALKDNLSWLLGGLGAAGGMMRNVGFAVLLKIMLSNDLWGIFLAGFAAAAILGNISATAGACLILVAFIGVAIAINDFNVSLRIKENAGNGGMSDGI